MALIIRNNMFWFTVMVFTKARNEGFIDLFLLPADVAADSSGEVSTVESSEETTSVISASKLKNGRKKVNSRGTEEIPERGAELALLDLYSGCGAMSTGLCMGARLTGANLVSVRVAFIYYSIHPFAHG